MEKITINFYVTESPEKVFAFLTDFSRLTTWRSLKSIRLEPAGSLQVGTKLFSQVRAMGRRMEFINQVVELDSSRRYYSDRFLSGTFPIQSSRQVDRQNGGSRIIWETEFEPTGIMKLVPFLLKQGIPQGQLKDLAKLKEILQK